MVLVEIARTLNESLRPSDMPVRFGGEEFSVFLPGTTSENAKVIAARARYNRADRRREVDESLSS